MTPNKKSLAALLAAGGGLLLVFLLLLLIPGFTPISIAKEKPSPTPPAGGSGCTSSVHYFAYEATVVTPEGASDFGPKQSFKSEAEAVARFDKKICADPLFTATIVEFLANGKSLDPARAESNAKAFVASPASWQKAVNDLRAQISGFELKTINERYDSLGMIHGAKNTDMPKLTKFAELPLMGQSLQITLKDGKNGLLRVDCDLQPSVPKVFEKVVAPIVPEAPKPPVIVPPENPYVPPYVPPVTPVCPPGQTGTPPVCKDTVQQAPQNQGNLPQQQMPNPLPAKPEHAQPVKQADPPPVYVPPAPPAPEPAPVDKVPAPKPNPVDKPRPVAPPEPVAPKPDKPADTCVPAPGKTSC